MPNLYVVCREPLPAREDRWSFQVGPVLIAREDSVCAEAPLVRLTSPNFSTGLLAEAMGELIARATRGVLIAEGERLIADFDEVPIVEEAGFAHQFAELIADVEAELDHEANDWSELDSAA